MRGLMAWNRAAAAAIALCVAGNATAQSLSEGQSVSLLNLCQSQMSAAAEQAVSSSQGGLPSLGVSASQAGTPSISPLSPNSPVPDGFASTVMGLYSQSNKSARIRELQAALAFVELFQQMSFPSSQSVQLQIIRDQLISQLSLILP